jgi:quercetin dioxygenase-like cupin family protein
MNIQRVGSQPSGKGPADWFTGTVRIDSPFKGTDPARVTGAIVTFEPGARTAWHSHPLGQTLIVTAGCGRVQRWGGPVEEIRPGDVIWFPPGQKHWHRATGTTAMTPIVFVAVRPVCAGSTGSRAPCGKHSFESNINCGPGCGTCFEKKKGCPRKDDLAGVLETLETSKEATQ